MARPAGVPPSLASNRNRRRERRARLTAFVPGARAETMRIRLYSVAVASLAGLHASILWAGGAVEPVHSQAEIARTALIVGAVVVVGIAIGIWMFWRARRASGPGKDDTVFRTESLRDNPVGTTPQSRSS